MTTLSLHDLQTVDHLTCLRDAARVGLRSPARTLFSDFRDNEPHLIDGWMRATDASRHMHHSHDHAAMVVDRLGSVVGVILRDDLREERLMRRIANGERREEIRVHDLMTHRREIRALAADDLEHATVADVLQSLRDDGKRFCLVVDHDVHEIRGLISATEVARRLLGSVDLARPATFVEAFALIHG